MLISDPKKVDAYLKCKGLKIKLCESGWEELIEYVLQVIGNEIWHRARMITQQEDIWRRYSTQFPDGVPKPYKYIQEIELLVLPGEKCTALRDFLDARQIEWQYLEQINPETGTSSHVGIKIYGIESES